MEFTRIKITCRAEVEDMYSYSKSFEKPVVAIDTETTGFHIINDYAFMYQVLVEDRNYLINFLQVDEETKETFLNRLQDIVNAGPVLVFANAKFDLHKMIYDGIRIPHDADIKDVLIMSRLCAPADTIQRFGLKELGKSILGIEPEEQADLKLEERTIKKEILAQRNGFTRELVGLRFKELERMYYDPSSDLTDEQARVYEACIEEIQEFRYSDISSEVLENYAYNDTELTRKLYDFMCQRVIALDVIDVVELEHKSIMPILRMERTGFKIDFDYVFKARAAIREEYMIVLTQLRGTVKYTALHAPGISQEDKETLLEAAENGTIAQQHAMLKVFFRVCGINSASMDKQALDKIYNDTKSDAIKKFITGVKTLRRLSKWYGTYLSKYIKESVDGRFYCSIKQADTTTGRMSSDFHQFPKGDIISTVTGEVLFKPRNIVLPDGVNGFNSIYYFDYSQIELRIQAHYTMLFAEPGDKNLCRAFMPFRTFEKDGKYWLEEDPETEWQPIDLHSMTTATAFPDLDQNSKEFKNMRGYGKATNFAKNYGGGVAALNNIMGDKVSSDVIDKLDQAYDTAFPKVKEYGNEVTRRLRVYGEVRSLAGRKYTCRDTRFFYKCNNYVIQGSGVDILKRALIRLDEFIIKNNLKTQVQMAIHDELSFLVHEDEEGIVETYFKTLMEVNDFGMEVPIVCDVEKTTTNWGDKYEI